MAGESSGDKKGAMGEDAQAPGIMGKFFGAKKGFKKAKMGESLTMYYNEEVR